MLIGLRLVVLGGRAACAAARSRGRWRCRFGNWRQPRSEVGLEPHPPLHRGRPGHRRVWPCLAAAFTVTRRLINQGPQPLPLAHATHHPHAALSINCRSLFSPPSGSSRPPRCPPTGAVAAPAAARAGAAARPRGRRPRSRRGAGRRRRSVTPGGSAAITDGSRFSRPRLPAVASGSQQSSADHGAGAAPWRPTVTNVNSMCGEAPGWGLRRPGVASEGRRVRRKLSPSS
jgi:hypothetical protein